MGIYVTGVVKGIKVREWVIKDTGEVKKAYYVGFAEMVDDDYDQREVLTEVRISDRLANAGLQARYEKLKGQEVMAPCFVMANARGGKAYINYYFADDGMPMPVMKKAAQVS